MFMSIQRTSGKWTVTGLIRSRRTIHQFKSEPVPDEATIRAAMEQAIWAPNHHLTQPWRFYLLGAESKERICLLNAQLVNETQGERAAQVKLRRWREVPGWLVLTCRKSDDAVTMRENYASCCCVAQNLMLILWDGGVGVKWTTGAVTRTRTFHDIIGVDCEQEEVVGLFWYGFPAEVPAAERLAPEQVITALP